MFDRIGLGLALAATVLLSGCDDRKGEARHVLPTDVTPIHYDIAVRPDPAALTFTGSVGADVRVVKATSTVTLNAADLTFGKVQLDGSNVSPRVVYDAKAQTATLSFAQPL